MILKLQILLTIEKHNQKQQEKGSGSLFYERQDLF